MPATLSKEEKNTQLIYRLKKKVEERQRAKFYEKFSNDPATLYKELLQHKPKFDRLLAKHVMKKEQYDLLLPSSKLTNAEQFDSTLLHLLLRELCGYQNPQTGWDIEPPSTDRTTIANLIRLKIGRNRISHTTKITDKFLKTMYNLLKQPLLDLGCPIEELNNLTPPPVQYNFIPAIPSFVSREDVLNEVHDGLKTTKNLPGILGFVITGIPGVGKTQLARKYFEKHSNFFDNNIAWINAENETSLNRSFKDLATTLGLNVKNEQGHFCDIENIIKKIHDYFFHDSILFVFDNVDNSMDDIIKFIPKSIGSFTLITSQNKFWGQSFQQLQLNVLTQEASVQLFSNQLNVPATEDVIKAISEQVQHHPLALQQIISYVQQTKTPISIYRDMLENQLGYLLSNSVLKDAAAVSEDANKTSVIATFKIAINKVKSEKSNALAVELLHVMCYLDGKEIRMGYFVDLSYGDKFDTLKNIDEINKALRVLQKYSIVGITTDGKNIKNNIITMHSLIQEAIKEQLKESQSQIKCFTNLLQRILAESVNFDAGKYWHKQFIYIYKKHDFENEFLSICKNRTDFIIGILFSSGNATEAEAIITSIEAMLEADKDSNNDLLFKVKLSIVECRYKCCKFDEALLKLMSFIPKVFNQSDIHWNFQLKLANCYYCLRDFYEAFKYYQKACEFDVQNAGKYTLLCLQTKSFIARCLRYKGEINKSLALYKEVLQMQTKFFDKRHPDVLATKRRIAGLLSDKHQFDEALTIYDEVYNIDIQQFGECHPTVLNTKHWIAICLNRKGQIDEALRMYNEIYHIQVELFGLLNSDVLLTKYNIANILLKRKQTDEALTIFREVYEAGCQLFDESHIDVLYAKSSIALCLFINNKFDEALTMYTQIYEVYLELYGDRDFKTMTVKYNIAVCLQNKGEINKALNMFQEVYKVRIHLYSDHNLNILNCQYGIAVCLAKQHEYKKALTIFREVFEARELLLGECHEDVLSAKHNLSSCLERTMHYDEALTKFQELYEVKVQLFGKRHLEVLKLKHSIAVCLAKKGQTNKALKLFHEVLDMRTEILDASHPDISETKKCIKYWGP